MDSVCEFDQNEDIFPVYFDEVEHCFTEGIMNAREILGFHSRDETAILVYKTMSLKLCIIIELNSQKNFFAVVLYTNMAAVTSRKNREYPDLCFKKWPFQIWLMRAGGTRITTTTSTAILLIFTNAP